MSEAQGASAQNEAGRDYLFTPMDTLFFREGQAFHQGETNHIDSAFPPTPRTFQGLIRSKFLRDQHPVWLENPGGFREAIAGLVGSPERPSERIEGPHLVRWDGERATPYLVLPHFWWVREGRLHRRRLAPGRRMGHEPAVGSSDWLEYQPYPGDKSPAPSQHYLAWPRLRELLYGELGIERDCLVLDELGSGGGESRDSALLPPFRLESRTLVAMDPERGSKRDGMLNFTRQVRLEEDFGFWCRSGFELKTPSVAPLGGMGRLCRVEALKAVLDWALPAGSAARMAKAGRFWLILTEPLRCTKEAWPWQEGRQKEGRLCFIDRKGKAGELRVSLLSAILGPPLWIGGYDLLRGRPAGQQAYLSPGSAYLFEIKEPRKQGEREECLGRMQGGWVLGDENESRMGFGQMLVAPFSEAHLIKE